MRLGVMKPRLLKPTFALFLRQWVEWLPFDQNSAQFLKERNARVTVQAEGSQSFFVVKVLPSTDIATPTGQLRIRVKLLSHQMLRVSVYSQANKRYLVDITSPLDQDGGAMTLNMDNIRLKIEMDAHPPAHP